MKTALIVSALTVISFAGLTNAAEANIFSKMLEPYLQAPVKPKASSFVIEDEIEITTNAYTAFYRMRSIDNMIYWSPNTSFRGKHDVNDRIETTVTLSTGTEKFREIILSSSSQEICSRVINTSSLLFNRQTCRRMRQIDEDTFVYSHQLIIDGFAGVIKAKGQEAELREAIRLELEGLRDFIELGNYNGMEARRARGEW